MPRTVWSGAISFGLVTVPINVQSATEDHSFRFHQYHLEDMGRVRVRKYCEVEDREVTNDEIGKGYELSKTQVIPISDDELRDLPLPTAKAIEIEAFVPLESVDPIRIGEGYYLAPSGQVAAKPYKLLREALARSSKVAVAKYAWSGRERLGLLRVRDDVIVLHAMRWPDEIRDPSELLPPPVEVTDEEIDSALALMDSMTSDDLEGEEFQDSYTEAIAQLLDAKREHREPPHMEEPEAKPGQIVDLMAALNESVQQARASRGEDADVHEMPKKKAAAKKQPAKKAAAKKPARKSKSA
ncbi:Ku protein [Streptomyces swartbergensis]|uniref:Non-homologous end joining protein Ku n=1 Tax=Streptomyces swartbergensis TaxID=487165 RepID=A0A243SCE9_9ACTN|nr:Ku protein [Streptomyces swartbergensis]OUD04720.1 Ku protein [Streptomyces swartbergensis]